MLEGRVPRAAWDRPKHGFIAPVARWLREDLRDLVEDQLFSSASLGRELFDARGLRGLWDAHRSGRADHTHELWMLLMLETWHRLHTAPTATVL
jgi:asparagine synthase (glutamine-hydrolysing)